MRDHSCAIDAVFATEGVDGLAVDVTGDDLRDLIRRQPSLHLTGTPDDGNALVLVGSADDLLKCRRQFVFRE